MREKYTTILIGNGLGMAIDPDHFSMRQGLKYAWNEINEETQARIKNLITNQAALEDEDQLDKHYAAIQACLMLSRIEEHSNIEWLLPEARTFPDNFRKFVENVAWHFFEYQVKDPEKLNIFFEKLKKYILDNNTHLITLNYDKIIYDRFATDKEIMNQDKGKLVDGFHVKGSGFESSHITSVNDSIGYYLHLHGSPFFYTNLRTGIINKDSFKRYLANKENQNFLREHLILCKTTLKPTQISYSTLLNSYWDFFKIALKESNKIILIGYSGNDIHINQEIANIIQDREIIIVDYANPQLTKQNRQSYWRTQLKLPRDYLNDKNFIWLDSILDYNFEK